MYVRFVPLDPNIMNKECPILLSISWKKPIPKSLIPMGKCSHCNRVHYWALLEASRQTQEELHKYDKSR